MPTDEGQLNAAIAALWARQRDEMLRRVDVVEDAVVALLEGALDDERRDAAERAAHKIAGAAGTFGFPEASRNGREIELALREGRGMEVAPRLSELVIEIRRAFEAPAEGEPRTESGSLVTPSFDPAHLDVLIVCGDRLSPDELQAELVARGLSVAVARAADDAALQAEAAVAVLDLAEPLSDEFIAGLPPDCGIALIGLAADTSLNARVAFADRGGRILLPGDAPSREIAEAVDALRERVLEDSKTVLVVDDDAPLLELTSTVLRGHGLGVVELNDPSRFWQTLEASNPDVLLLDLEMPGFSGLDLCRAVRADPRWSQLPVLFLTARTEPEMVRAVFAAGADDYMAKPVVEEELLQRIDNRLERISLLRELADRDALTGVASRRKADEQVARLERLSKRYGQPLTLAILDLDHFKSINDSYGHDTGDEVLRRLGRRLQREFRGEDVVGRWGGEEFMIGMYGMPLSNAVERMRGLLDDWKRERFDNGRGGQFTASFSVGIAELPGTAESVEDLQRAADDALYRAKAAGRSRVQAAGERASSSGETVDIAVVEDDTALIELLTHSLSTQGWSVRVLDDGPTAVGALASEPPLLQARLVLLDWDLPGMDGLAVLRRLRERGVLSNTRVVMLTARGGESEVLKALELGALDHVTKPFSVPVLLQKVRQILSSR